MCRHLNVGGKFVAFEKRVAAPPFRVIHRTGRAALRFTQAWRGLGKVADAACEPAFRVAREHLIDLVALERPVRDERRRQAVFTRDHRHPARLTDRIGGIPPGLLVHRLHDAVLADVAPIIRRHVVLLDRGIVAVAEVHGHRIAEPRVIVLVQPPEMLVHVDDRNSPLRLAKLRIFRHKQPLTCP
jgi:hypothetical protein